jgi:hypothetical protein
MTGTHEIDRNPRVNGHDWSGGVESCKNCGLTRSKWGETWWTCTNPRPLTKEPSADTMAERNRCLEIAAEELRCQPDGDGRIAALEIFRSIREGAYAPTIPPDFDPIASTRVRNSEPTPEANRGMEKFGHQTPGEEAQEDGGREG